MSETPIDVTVNGVRYQRSVPARTSLADFVRDSLGLTGTHLGCEHGVCGSCTVLRDGRAVRSCLTLAAQADASEVQTVEGLTLDGLGRQVADALIKHHGMQCGFCTPGFVVSIVDLLRSNPDPDEDEVRAALSGNVCRCTGYSGIVAATLEVAATLTCPRSSASDTAERRQTS
ncbi:(2Fe-2S)-binding protein [Saccharopolyspora shandongensis]|uniref:(2Fe-2S)-binding protein n=1 Tax=Saccharopolyspora shandongensis TaxID=418495 RepID=UPI003406C8D8